MKRANPWQQARQLEELTGYRWVADFSSFGPEGLFGFRGESDLKLPGERIDELLQLSPSSTIHAMYLVLGPFTLELMQFDPPSAPESVQTIRFMRSGS